MRPSALCGKQCREQHSNYQQRLFHQSTKIFCAIGLKAQSLEEQFAALPSVKKVEVLDKGEFCAKYLLWFEQPVSYSDASKGVFLQRVFVGNVSTDSSTVFVTEGYGAEYASRDRYATNSPGCSI